MRIIERSSAFKKDYKRESKGPHKTILSSEILPVFEALVNDQPLDVRYRDHDLIGQWSGYRECHIKPDLLLVYSIKKVGILRLARLGSHSELFG
jgi:mRNA interferase YafQ